ncbi:MAG TPA: hypothetical protein VK444_03020 [Methanobacteriaceae archaeon]|nr:hypothetical protein [Methanobacteriaceae archaeon]
MNKYLKIVFFGFLVWLIPFVASLFFYTSGGKLIIDIFLFKAIMIVIGSISGAILLILYFKKIHTDYFKEGIILGVVWFSINILLDLLVLVSIFGMPIADYFTRIGVGYIVILVMCITVGTALANNCKEKL